MILAEFLSMVIVVLAKVLAAILALGVLLWAAGIRRQT